ncbi:MAG TPA: peptidogalycan biosysnthesis protein, partial [Roseiarcus sp.]|nr:peptidogalycan biosysnthesis protein [Roseiarcus sp.]
MSVAPRPDRFAPMASPFTARVHTSVAAINAAAWDACANPPGRSFEEAEGERFNPFLAHAFLNALEASGSVGGRSGWGPAHV